MFRSTVFKLKRATVRSRRLFSFDRHSAEQTIQLGPKKISIAFAAGLAAGALGGMVGLGGGFLVQPILLGPLGLTQHLAHGTSMAAALFTSAGGAYSYFHNPHPDELKQGKPNRNSNDNCNNSENNNGNGKVNSSDSMKSLQTDSEIGFLEKLSSLSHGQVDVPTAVGVALSASLFAIAGARLSTKLSSNTLRIWRGMLQMIIAPTIILRDELKNKKVGENSSNSAQIEKKKDDLKIEFLKSLAIGSVSGLQAGIFG